VYCRFPGRPHLASPLPPPVLLFILFITESYTKYKINRNTETEKKENRTLPISNTGFYGPDALPATQTTVSKHGKPPRYGLILSHESPDSWEKGVDLTQWPLWLLPVSMFYNLLRTASTTAVSSLSV